MGIISERYLNAKMLKFVLLNDLEETSLLHFLAPCVFQRFTPNGHSRFEGDN